MGVYDIHGVDLVELHQPDNLSFERHYVYINGWLECERKDIVEGALVDSTTRCVIKLPKVGYTEVRTFTPAAKFKVIKINNGTATILTPGSDWWYYMHRFIGDGESDYYALVANIDDTTAITAEDALLKIAVYDYTDVGSKSLVETSLYGKKIAIIGDSITQGRFRKFSTSSGLDGSATKPFGALIAEEAGDMNYGNFGIGGALVSGSEWKSLLTNCSKVTGYDVVFICGGTNDYGGNVSATNFTNAMNTIISTLKSNNTEVVAVSPVYRTSKTGPNTQGLTLKDYADLIAASAESANIKYLDIYTPTEEGFIQYCPDGLHPNEIGHKIMADLIINGYEEANA